MFKFTTSKNKLLELETERLELLEVCRAINRELMVAASADIGVIFSDDVIEQLRTVISNNPIGAETTVAIAGTKLNKSDFVYCSNQTNEKGQRIVFLAPGPASRWPHSGAMGFHLTKDYAKGDPIDITSS